MTLLLLTLLASPVLWWRVTLKRRITTGRILVIQTAKIGDFVATTPVFLTLKKLRPRTEIVALLHPATVPLAEGMDCIDLIVQLPAGGLKGLAGKRWLLGLLAEGFDGVLILSPNMTNLLAPFWASIPLRVAVLPDRRQGIARLARPFLTHGEPHARNRLFRETALRSLGGLGLTIDQETLNQAPEIMLNSAGEIKREALMRAWTPPYVGVGIGAGNPMKALQPTQLSNLIANILRQVSGTVILVGTATEQALAAKLCAEFPPNRVLDTTGQWTLAELPSLLAALDCYVGVDSGATYIADALRIPVIDFMGPADADDQRPTGPGAIIIHSNKPCAPCSHTFDAPYRCRLGTRACVVDAPISKMTEHVVSSLKK